MAGAWVGTATLDGQATPFEVEFHACGAKLCGRWSLPDLGYRWMPLRDGAFDPASGRLDAAPLTGALAPGRITGELTGHGGGVFVDAIPRGRHASFDLHRGAVRPLGVRVEPVTFRDGDVVLAGSFVRPEGRIRHPAIVFVHGSGPSTRWYAFGRAVTLARLGYASLVYDKRGNGESGGDWTRASLDDLARDAVAAVDFVAARGDVDSRRIGLWGHSQGGWVVPRAIALGAKASFAVVLAGGGATPRQVETRGYERTLDYLGATPDARSRAMALVGRYFDYLDGKIDADAIKASMDQVRSESWFRPLGIERVLPDEPDRAKWAWVADYDPATDIGRLGLPLLLVFGGDDEEGANDVAIARWNEMLSRAQALRTRIVYLPRASHHFRIGAGGWPREAPAFGQVVNEWLADLP